MIAEVACDLLFLVARVLDLGFLEREKEENEGIGGKMSEKRENRGK